ncbi:thiosulfate oxidation carrier protein SoxY [Pseudomethylobacillus aquaticus]|uniref:Thiosulfate oxidation carrier protein SoxY n=1 Tax=Pseudomethylobacillus aquaticus TaxID=2676064 RepID=A0A3N0V021_9PROT|nr:thiosulfate oxidation carrier protein SoxY [Pseudomethylobacillus aquaticus]ROH85838.1 thiosulfate oxidation carrier protein SoxY [Pseudomethylobacillus aquaticus]
MQRRHFLGMSLASLLLLPLQALAALWNKAAFEAATVPAARQHLQVASEQPSSEIDIVAPDFAENGAVVQVEVRSRIANTEAIAILVDKNPTPLIANFMFSNGADPYVVTRIKMAESAQLQVIVKVGEHYFTASKQVQVSLGGCG